MKYARFTRVTDNKVFEIELEDELWNLFQETGEYIEKMKAVVEAAKRCCEPSNLTADTARRWQMERDLEYLKKALEELEK